MIVQSQWKNYWPRHKSYQPLEEMEELLPDTTELERSVQALIREREAAAGYDEQTMASASEPVWLPLD